MAEHPNTVLEASGEAVGLPPGQVGNSEAGHMNLGAGRRVIQDSVVVTEDIRSGGFFKNKAILECIHHVKQNGSMFHLMGLLTGNDSAHAGSAVMGVFLVLARQSLSGVIDVDSQIRASQVRSIVYGCADEVLVNLAATSLYTTTNVQIGDEACDVVITTPTAETRSVLVTRTDGGITRGVRVGLSVDPVVVTSVEETLN